MQPSITTDHALARESERKILNMLGWIYLCIFIIVVVGGITRLTNSGLSMVYWKPITGILPPLSEASWMETLDHYKLSPEGRILNHQISLSEFKWIFFWEYLHRMLGRLVGLLALFLLGTTLFDRHTRGSSIRKRSFLIAVLIGLQGLLGWYMVKSGLHKIPYVSHLRLAAHLSLAFFTAQFTLWTALDLWASIQFRANPLSFPSAGKRQLFTAGLWSIILLLCCQIIFGAFTAGLKLGYAFNTFPKMLGAWIPPGILGLSPWWKDVTGNPVTIQFVHRVLGVTLCLLSVALLLGARSWVAKSAQYIRTIEVFLGFLFLQLALGIATLILRVPLGLALVHQALAFVLLSLSVCLAHKLHSRSLSEESALRGPF